jgi:phosphopantothenoylcysteine decarboxylase/phosphopantothenate--cysteine ligase
MPPTKPPTILITAGPTYEPIDAVRFIGNRSSGRLGIELARAALTNNNAVTLLLGPNTQPPPPDQTGLAIIRFRSCADLENILKTHWPDRADILIMAAAVADYRPTATNDKTEKIRRNAGPLTLNLESTPDLVAACAARKRTNQLLIGFALEPASELADRATAKLKRKQLDAIVANPLETMDAPDIDATLFLANGSNASPGRLSKPDFAHWLITQSNTLYSEKQNTPKAVS